LRRAPLLALWCALAAGGAAIATGATRCPPPGRAAASERCVRRELGIPRRAKRVLVLSQSSHLDWDWLMPFEGYFETKVDGIFQDAFGLLSRFHGADHHYYYSIAEVGYLQRFVEAHPELAPALRDVGNDLRIVGGGITSPDNLLPAGEAFIRDYLVGKTWIDATLGLPIRQAWVPDDFGHDSQLPIVLEAMGFQGVGFSRVPGVDTLAGFFNATRAPAGSVAARLIHDGIDFVWRAADGSETLAHWMPDSYCEGAGIRTTADVGKLLAINGPASPTPYVFLPIGCDFQGPKAALLDLVSEWNREDYPRTGVWAVAASFDHYVQLVDGHRRALRRRRFDPTPYWMGFYAMRPLLKSLHLRATQALLGAETFGAIADASARGDVAAWREEVRARTAAIHAGWATLVPSNHHDYITGTALDPVYTGEQVPRLTEALARGEAERARALGDVVAAIRRGPHTLVVFNQLGFARRALVEDTDGGAGEAPQRSAEGNRLFVARVPSLGYATEARAAVASRDTASLTVREDGAAAVLENRFLRAVISRDAGWGITSLLDKRSHREVIQPGEVANAFVVYADDGGLYRFGSEMAGCALTPRTASVTGGEGSALETGPLRARFVGRLLLDGRPYEKEYQLVAEEPYLRMISTGAAADGTSVMAHFPLAGRINRLIHGTPYHWDHKRPERAGPGLTFEATHDFLLAESRGRPLGAIFHAGVPAWAARRDGLLIGALWRNAMQERCEFYGASGTDPEPHAVSYALRVPTGIHGPRSGSQLREALAFTTPLLAAAGQPAGSLPPRFSLASVTPRRAIITAAKPGTVDPSELVLRVYQPTNSPLRITVRTRAPARFPPGRLTLHGLTALEDTLPRARALRVGGHASRFGFTARRALTTIGIRRAG